MRIYYVITLVGTLVRLEVSLRILYAWMNGYSTFLRNSATDKYIVIKVDYSLQLHLNIFLNKSEIENNNKNNRENAHDFGL